MAIRLCFVFFVPFVAKTVVVIFVAPGQRTCWKAADAGDPDVEPFGTQALALDLQASPEAAQTAAGCNHAMARYTGIPALPHHRSDGAGGARRAGELSDVAVGGDAPRWNAPHDGNHPPLEFRCHGEPLTTHHHQLQADDEPDAERHATEIGLVEFRRHAVRILSQGIRHGGPLQPRR